MAMLISLGIRAYLTCLLFYICSDSSTQPVVISYSGMPSKGIRLCLSD